MTNNMDITIIGAGLSGSLLSILLAKQGHRVQVFESRPDMRKTDISAGRSINLALSSRGIVALKAIDQFESLAPMLVPMYGRQLHQDDGQSQFQSYSRTGHDAIYSASRADLNKLLLDAAEETGRVQFHFDSPCEQVSVQDNQIELSSGARHAYQLCVGADGFNSKVRQSICAPEAVSIEPLHHQYKELTIPAKSGSFQMKREALHIWPRGEYMLIALPNFDGSFTVTLFLPKTGPVSFEQLTDASQVQSFFEKHFPDACQLMPDFAQQFLHNPTGELATVRSKQWNNQNTVLIGDAAHAVVPFHGQGMNCAFEDCLELAKQLQQPELALSAQLQAYTSARIDNANAIADLALENYIEMRSKVRDPRFHLKKAVAWQLEEQHPDLFIPRYDMVMFHEIPYALAKARGEIQNQILESLTNGKQSIDEIDFNHAADLIKTQLVQQ